MENELIGFRPDVHRNINQPLNRLRLLLRINIKASQRRLDSEQLQFNLIPPRLILPNSNFLLLVSCVVPVGRETDLMGVRGVGGIFDGGEDGFEAVDDDVERNEGRD